MEDPLLALQLLYKCWGIFLTLSEVEAGRPLTAGVVCISVLCLHGYLLAIELHSGGGRRRSSFISGMGGMAPRMTLVQSISMAEWELSDCH
jgi:hypothetical protein